MRASLTRPPMARRRLARRNRRGFSLIELMVVITIIGLLGSIVGVNVYSMMKKANISTTKTQMRQLIDSIKQFKMEKRRLPETLDELVGEDGFLDGDQVPLDAWNNDFFYEPRGGSDFELMSYGGDGQEGGEGEDADIDRAALSRRDDGEE